jgi:hypothetical protein
VRLFDGGIRRMGFVGGVHLMVDLIAPIFVDMLRLVCSAL